MEIVMSKLTIFLARILGIFTILIVVALAYRGSAIVEDAVADQPVMLTYGMISLGIGLAMVLGHNVWSGGLLPVAVTLVGWLILVKGLLLLLLAPDQLAQFYGKMHRGEDLYLYLPSFVIGLYLTWTGFSAHSRR
jgi:hypothetical protein